MSQYPPNGNNQQGPVSYNYAGFGQQPEAPKPQKPQKQDKSGELSAGVLAAILLGGVFFFMLVCGGFFALFWLPARGKAQDNIDLAVDVANLNKIGVALHSYQDSYKRFPAPGSINSEGVLVWSWRVPLLPHLDEAKTFDKIDMKEMRPWNDVENSFLRRRSPMVYRSTRVAYEEDSENCNIYLISSLKDDPGKQAFFVEGTYSKMGRCTDGLSDTLVAVVLLKRQDPWASPTNLNVSTAYQAAVREDKFFLGLFLSGEAKVISVDIDEETFKALVTCDGGEKVDYEKFVLPDPRDYAGAEFQ